MNKSKCIDIHTGDWSPEEKRVGEGKLGQGVSYIVMGGN